MFNFFCICSFNILQCDVDDDDDDEDDDDDADAGFGVAARTSLARAASSNVAHALCNTSAGKPLLN